MKIGKPIQNKVHTSSATIWLILFNNRSPIYDIDFQVYGEPLLTKVQNINSGYL